MRTRRASSKGRFLRGLRNIEQGRLPEAVEALKRAIQLKPDYAEAHLALGKAYLRLGDKDSALEEYKILKQLNRGWANNLFTLIHQ